MSFRRMNTEEGEIGEEGEIVANDEARNHPPPPNHKQAAPNARPPPPSFRRNSSTGVLPTTPNNTTNNNNNASFRDSPQQGFRGGGRGGRFPGGGRGGRFGGRGGPGRGVSRHHSWTAGQSTPDSQQSPPPTTSRWGPSNSSINEQRRESFGAPPQSSPIQRNPSFVGSSSSMPPRQPSFARAESTGSMGGGQQQRNFPPSTPPFNRSESFGARQNEQHRNEPFRSGNNDGFQGSPSSFARQDSFGRSNEQPFRSGGTSNEAYPPKNSNPAPFARQESFGGGRPHEPPRNEPFRGNQNGPPTPTFSRSESFGAGRQNEQPPRGNEQFRGGNNSEGGYPPNRDAFGRAERPQRQEDAFGRQPPPPHQQQPTIQSEMHSRPRPSGPLERGSSVSGPKPPFNQSVPPPPPPNLPPPPVPANLPPPPSQQQRRTSSYSSLAEQPPPIAPAPSIQRSPSYTGPPPASPSMPRRTSSFTGGGSDMRPPMRSPPQQDRRKVFDLSSSSSPQLNRQASAPSRFQDDSFRSSTSFPPPPPVTSSQLLSSSSSPTKRPWQPSPESPKKMMQPPPEVEAPKRPTESKLTVSSLGDPRLAARAEQVIAEMNQLVSFPQPTSGEVALPSKQLIMKAVAGLDLKIKKGQASVKTLQTQVEEMVQTEEAEANRIEEERRQEEQKRQDAETLRLEQERKARHEKRLEEHRKKVQVVIDERKRTLEDEQKRAQEALGEHIKRAQTEEHLARTREVQGQIEVAAQTFDKDIAKAQKALEKATEDTALAETKMAKVVAEYKQSKENETALPDLSRERERESPEMRAMISRIQAENKRRAQQAQLDSMYLLPYTPSAGSGDSGVKTNEQWTNEARQVTGLANALYTEPSESPFYEKNNRTHALIEPIVTEIVRHKKRRLQDKWEGLAEEYVVRKDIYDKTHTVLHKEKHSTPTSHPSIFGSKPSPISSRETAPAVTGGRSTSNPYRRARRGQVGGSSDIVRSEYEQEQIIAEITAKEAMEKRIKHGGSKLPRQVCQLEKDLNGTYIQTFEARHVDDPLEESMEQKNTNVWSDMEKCIFLDRFLQHPKDFRKIASFLRNKSTKDCVAFYYDSKQSVPYKKALKEFLMRRKRRGDYHVWDSTIQASLSVGAVITAGTDESKPLVFSLPQSDKTYFTRNFHPLNRELLDSMVVNAADVDMDMLTSPKRERKNRKRPSDDPLFTLDPSQRKLLRSSSNDKAGEDSEELEEEKTEKTATRKAPQKWTAAEKRIFHDTLEKHGKNWTLLAAAISTKNMTQIKNYYYDHKKEHKRGRSRGGGDGDTRSSAAGSTDGESDFAERTEMYLAGAGAAQDPAEAMRSAAEAVELTEQQRAALNAHSIQSAADIWARAQIEQRQAQQLQEQQLQQHLSSQEARRLLHSHQHQQVISNISSMFPWVTAAHVAQAQAQAAALQQQQPQQPQQQPQQQQVQHDNAGIDWTDQATQMQNLLAMRQAQAGAHHGYSGGDPNSHIRSMALAGLAAMNQQSLQQQQQQQVDNVSYSANEADRTNAEGQHGDQSNAALALGMLAQQSTNNGQHDESRGAEQQHEP